MKKCCVLLALVMLLSILALPASTAETGMTYDFALSANGQETLEAECGDIITVTLKLKRTDRQEYYDMYGMQAELRYDSTCLELVPDSASTYNGVNTSDVELADGYREFYMNFLSFSGGTKWEPEVLIGSVQFKVIGTAGVTKITNEDFMVSLPDGSGSYGCTSNELLIVLSTECTVSFASNGGTAVESQTVIFGEAVTRPEDPIREGYRFVGWYRDIHLTQEWDFDTDTAQSNMTLYAKWEKAEPAETIPTEPNVPDPSEPGPGESVPSGPSSSSPAPTSPGPNDPSPNDPEKPGWPWWILLLLILLVAAWLYWRSRKEKQKKQN